MCVILLDLVFTLKMPAMDRVKLDVCVTTRYSLSSMAKAKNAPNDTLNTHGKISPVGRDSMFSINCKPERKRFKFYGANMDLH